MSDNSTDRYWTDRIEQTRKVLYADKTDTQMVMIALADIMKRVGGAPVIIAELYVRYHQPPAPSATGDEE